MKRRIVFLDFDGVLNWLGMELPSVGRSATAFGSPAWGAAQLDEAKVQLVNQILDATGAAVVLTTSWKDVHPLEYLRLILRMKGFTGYILGTVASGTAMSPEDRILTWLEAMGGVHSFIVLDDMPVDGLEGRQIRTDLYKGLQEEDVPWAISLLLRD